MLVIIIEVDVIIFDGERKLMGTISRTKLMVQLPLTID